MGGLLYTNLKTISSETPLTYPTRIIAEYTPREFVIFGNSGWHSDGNELEPWEDRHERRGVSNDFKGPC
jgi:hypothetical protein